MLWLLCSISVWAFSIPNGWVKKTEKHAIFQQGKPEKGEIFEVVTSKKTIHDLGFVLMDYGFEIVKGNFNSYGDVVLVGKKRKGKARWSIQQKKWVVMLFSAEYEKMHDVDALLQQSLFAKKKSKTPWGKTSKKDGEWSLKAKENTMVRDQQLVGKWVGSGSISGIFMSVTLFIDADGSFRMQRKNTLKTEVVKGYWFTNKGRLELQYNGKKSSSSYRSLGGTLEFEFEKSPLSMQKK